MTKQQSAPVSGVQAAIRSLDAIGVRGTQAMLARRAGVTRSAVQSWDRKKVIPLGRLPSLIEITGLPPGVLRPDYRDAYRNELGLDADEVFREHRNGKSKRAK